MTMREVLMLEANRDRYRTPFANACEPPCAIFLSRVGKKPWKEFCSKTRRNTAVYEGRKKSRIKARRRKRPPAKSLLPAVRAVDGGFQVVRSGVYLSGRNKA